MSRNDQTTFPKKHRKGKKFDTAKKFGVKPRATQVENEEIRKLNAAYRKIVPEKIEKLTDFPLSQKTQKGLHHAKFTDATAIQRQSIGLALQGHDILGAAKTGSGKTLAFLIPVLEKLYREKWTAHDGLGALIISPTRELAYQIFEVLLKIGKYHEFSAGLVIGGKHIREEAERINRTNIVICTPGRLLQHMDETAYFNSDNLHILVLDEADRILDLGFQKTMNAIIQNLPSHRQTLLFSATQTKSVRDLARLSLKDPMYVSVHEHAQHSTPTQLQQSYIVCNLEDKFTLVWSFIKHHLKAKTLVFMSSCKQVRFVHEVFRRMRPGVPVMALHGSMQQMKRMAVYDAFCRKQNAVLFATDIAARGLDFPAINWVLQLDCPEDANTYIHRAGRTARYEENGEALLILLPNEEEAVLSQLEAKKIPIEKIKINPKKQRSIQGKLESMLAAEVQMKEFAQGAFMSYLKSVFYMSNKSVFDVTKLDLDALSRSYGLAITPRVRFIEREKKGREDKAKKQTKLQNSSGSKGEKMQSKIEESGSEEDGSSESESSSGNSGGNSSGDSGESSSESDSENSTKKIQAGAHLSFGNNIDEDDDLGDILKVKKPAKLMPEEEKDTKEESQIISVKTKGKTLSKVAAAKKVIKKQLQVNTKVLFTEDGEEISDVHRKQQSKMEDAEEDFEGGINLEVAKRRLKEEDKFDKQLYRDKIKQRHRAERLKAKEERRKENQKKHGEHEELEVVLGGLGKGAEDLVGIPGRLGDPDHSGSESEAESWNSADYSSDGESGPPAKLRKLSKAAGNGEDNMDDDNDYEDFSDDGEEEEDSDTGQDLRDDEMMALSLLQGSS